MKAELKEKLKKILNGETEYLQKAVLNVPHDHKNFVREIDKILFNFSLKLPKTILKKLKDE